MYDMNDGPFQDLNQDTSLIPGWILVDLFQETTKFVQFNLRNTKLNTSANIHIMLPYNVGIPNIIPPNQLQTLQLRHYL